MNFDVLDKFEKELSRYTGAPYIVLTDSCTHAIELCFRLNKYNGPVMMPRKTYVSVLMAMHKLGLPVYFDSEIEWEYEYRIAPLNIWDSARAFDKDMYIAGRQQCLSFGWDKRLAIGHGGAILLDNIEDYHQLKAMAYDGRHLENNPWQTQKDWKLGFHYNMRLEDAQKGIEMLSRLDELPNKQSQLKTYPDVSKLNIIID
jgi:dTDP-4-amino-4,6-dideoxygalactose transaminase